jgi:hypothetical protein
MGGKLVSFDERIDEVAARNPDPEPEVAKKLGRPYWDVEREVGRRVETMLFAIIRARHVLLGLKRQEDIPYMIMSEIERRGGIELDV